MNKKYDYSVYIGRFQPFHTGHYDTVKQCLEISNKVIVLIGSSNIPRNIKNPFSDQERINMIRSSFSKDENDRILINLIEDRFYQNQLWISNVQKIIRGTISKQGWMDKPSVVLTGYNKDDTSWYLNSFPHWDYHEIEPFKGNIKHAEPINATEIRELMYNGRISYIENVVPENVYNFLAEFSKTTTWKNLQEEYKHALEYEKMYENYPYAINFLTTDAVVIQSGHILLVKRNERPGKGLWALPGGHIDSCETAEEAVIRELKEETCLKVPEKVLKGSFKEVKVFDHPERSLRCRISSKKGRTITIAHAFILENTHKLPRVKGSSDAAKAWWFPIGEIETMKHVIFEDHHDIMTYFINKLN